MIKNFLPAESREVLLNMLEQGETDAAFEQLATPLHEELYRRQTFDFLDELPVIQQVILAFDYIEQQTAQGGFIQLIQNGYISLLLTVIEGLQQMKRLPDVIKVLDDVLKIYVLNRDALDKETTVEEFSKLYNEFKEFEISDQQFAALATNAKKEMVTAYYA